MDQTLLVAGPYSNVYFPQSPSSSTGGSSFSGFGPTSYFHATLRAPAEHHLAVGQHWRGHEQVVPVRRNLPARYRIPSPIALSLKYFSWAVVFVKTS